MDWLREHRELILTIKQCSVQSTDAGERRDCWKWQKILKQFGESTLLCQEAFNELCLLVPRWEAQSFTSQLMEHLKALCWRTGREVRTS